MEEVEAGRRPVVVRFNVPLFLEVRAVRAHDLDGPDNELADLNEGTRGGLLSELLDLRASARVFYSDPPPRFFTAFLTRF